MTNIKYWHLGARDPKNGVITVASILKDGYVQYAVSYCSPRDTFSKKKGIMIATNRLNSVPYSSVDVLEEERKSKSINLAIMCDIFDNKNYPDWAYWLILDSIDWNSTKQETSQQEISLKVGGKTITWWDDISKIETAVAPRLVLLQLLKD